jgi:hypothetical protein
LVLENSQSLPKFYTTITGRNLSLLLVQFTNHYKNAMILSFRTSEVLYTDTSLEEEEHEISRLKGPQLANLISPQPGRKANGPSKRKPPAQREIVDPGAWNEIDLAGKTKRTSSNFWPTPGPTPPRFQLDCQAAYNDQTILFYPHNHR